MGSLVEYVAMPVVAFLVIAGAYAALCTIVLAGKPREGPAAGSSRPVPLNGTTPP